MLEVARAQLLQEQVTFVEMEASEIGALLPHPLDRIFCNMTFGKIQDRHKFLLAVHALLAPKGLLAFNLLSHYSQMQGGFIETVARIKPQTCG